MDGEEISWLTVPQVRTLWPGVGPVHETAVAHGVRFRTDTADSAWGPHTVVRYHADDIRRVAPRLTAAAREPSRRSGLAGFLFLLLLLALLTSLVVWAWHQSHSSPYTYWH
ncbi:hypothetical protein [Saccharothrix sp. ST-888]|uniref:hypothetical protein n=1 Tax=Saccharothrix sp. ST-888 TaxID=1427391 RepID=UPI0005EBF96A|nr:hypothetical protein [Saccharothrix sp. ST-888]KJK55483.1 hypothetical protein UK12_28350 [Saccharothrix sp. ST-888]